MATETKALAKKETLESLLKSPEFQEKLQTVLPKQMPPKRLVQIALLAMSRQPTLYECTPHSILNSVMKSAELGLDCVGTLGQGYLVPFWNGKINAMECQFIPGYQGLITLARRSGQIKKIEARVIRAGDVFKARYGTNPEIIHEPKLPADGAVIGYYAVATLSDGTCQFEIMMVDEIEKIRNRSQSKNKKGEIVGPWATDFDEMAKKTVVRRLCKYLPLSPELAEAIEADNEQYEQDTVERIVVSSTGGISGLKEILTSAAEEQSESVPAETTEANLKDEPQQVNPTPAQTQAPSTLFPRKPIQR